MQAKLKQVTHGKEKGQGWQVLTPKAAAVLTDSRGLPPNITISDPRIHKGGIA